MKPSDSTKTREIFVRVLICSPRITGIGKVANNTSVEMLTTVLNRPILVKVDELKHFVVGRAFKAMSQEALTGMQEKSRVPAHASPKQLRKTELHVSSRSHTRMKTSDSLIDAHRKRCHPFLGTMRIRNNAIEIFTNTTPSITMILSAKFHRKLKPHSCMVATS
jgi:hypothetical protein